MSLDANWLAVEPLIVQRLQDRLPGMTIATAPDLASVAEASKHTPSVHVLYSGYTVADSGGASGLVSIDMQWITVVTVRSTHTPTSQAAPRSEAGEIAREVFRALHKWKPGVPSAKPLDIVPTASPGWHAGFFYMPLGWSSKVIFKSGLCDES